MKSGSVCLLALVVWVGSCIVRFHWRAYDLMHTIQRAPFARYITPSHNETSSRYYAVVSLFVANPNGMYMAALCKLGAAIDRYASIDRVVLVVNAGVDAMLPEICGWIPQPVHALQGPTGVSSQTNTYLAHHLYTKLRVWELTQYAAVLYLDLDTLVVGPLGPLFEVHLPRMLARGQAIGMGHNTFPRGPDFNAGVILLVPDHARFQALVQSIDRVAHSVETAEQALLNACVAPEDVYLLPFQYNAMVSVKRSHPTFWAQAAPLSILHYTCKPWNMHNCWSDGIEELCLLWHWL